MKGEEPLGNHAITGDQPRAILGVERSISERRWVDRLGPEDSNKALAISQSLDIPDIVAQVLAGRGVDRDSAEQFLDPSIRDLMPDPYSMTDMQVAATRIAHAITNCEAVAVFGDYDVDGATSSALLTRFFAAYGQTIKVHIPDRIIEGYGPNIGAIDALGQDGAKLLITVDCGSVSFDPFAHARQIGLDVVVLDHHQCGSELPELHALVNANRQDDLSGLGQLAAVGVTFMTCVAVQRILREKNIQPVDRLFNLLGLLDLVALGTVCDVVPLTGLNRAFVRKGLLAFQNNANVGLTALSQVARLNGPATPYHLGFLLGPRINAGGRIGDAALGSRLLAMNDAEAAGKIAERLNVLNVERQALEAAMLEEAKAQADKILLENEDVPCLVTASDAWHPGIVGLLASRLKDKYRRPAFAIALGENGLGTGSGRSISGVDLGLAVRSAVDAGVIVKGGGHAMAAGMTIAADALDDVSKYFGEMLQQDVQSAGGENKIKIDGVTTALSATENLIDSLEQAGPFGAGNPEPVFAFPAHRIQYASIVGTNHVRCTLKSGDGSQLKAIAFRAADEPLGDLLLREKIETAHFVGSLTADYWQGRRQIQLRVIDAARSS